MVEIRQRVANGRGMYIAFEGIDGSGKSSRAREFHEGVLGRESSMLTTEPSHGEIGQLLRRALQSKTDIGGIDVLQDLFILDRAHHQRSFVIPMLNRGWNVVSDRSMWSTLGYGVANGLDMGDLLMQHERKGIIPPDITFYIKVSPETGMARTNRRGAEKELFESLGMQCKVFTMYEKLSSEHSDSWVVIDGEPEAQAVARSIETAWKDMLTRNGMKHQ